MNRTVFGLRSLTPWPGPGPRRRRAAPSAPATAFLDTGSPGHCLLSLRAVQEAGVLGRAAPLRSQGVPSGAPQTLPQLREL